MFSFDCERQNSFRNVRHQIIPRDSNAEPYQIQFFFLLRTSMSTITICLYFNSKAPENVRFKTRLLTACIKPDRNVNWKVTGLQVWHRYVDFFHLLCKHHWEAAPTRPLRLQHELNGALFATAAHCNVISQVSALIGFDLPLKRQKTEVSRKCSHVKRLFPSRSASFLLAEWRNS